MIAGWNSARHQKFDVGVVEGTWGTTYFLEAVGVGFFPQMIPLLSVAKQEKAFVSPGQELKYDLNALQTLLANYSPPIWKVRLDGQDFSGQSLLLEAMNIPYLGPNLGLAPEAKPDDGYLDVVFVSEQARERFRQYLASCLVGDSEMTPDFTVHRGKVLEIEWESSKVHVDSDIWAIGKNLFDRGDTIKRAAPGTIKVYLKHHALDFLIPSHTCSRID